ncbi:MAG: sulfotransferase [Saccharospirillum sp.]|nr:sulfotransferase [Saccharospirillum sp.]
MNSMALRSSLNGILPINPKAPSVIIGGMPKSGTTAIAKLLASLAGLSASSDPMYQIDVGVGKGPRNALYRGDITLAEVWKRYRQCFNGELVKDPNFPFFIDELFALFPTTKQVFIVRDPRDNIRSILDRLSLNGQTQEIDHAYQSVTGTWRNVLEGYKPTLPGTGHLEKMAWRWRVCTENYLAQKNNMTLIQYEAFRQNKKSEIESLAHQLGLECKHDISGLIDVQYQPKGKHISDWESYFGPDSLNSINEIVGPYLGVFGYEH